MFKRMITEQMIARSRASDDFKRDLRAFVRGGRAARIETSPFAPPVKVLRVLTQLLHTEPDLAVERVRVSGQSGCSDFVGTAIVEAHGARRVFDFTWCCRWRAIQEGWTDAFGMPDQIRAAHAFEWRCFERWTERAAGGVTTSAAIA